MENNDDEKNVNGDTVQSQLDPEVEKEKDLLKRLYEKAYSKDSPFETTSQFKAQQNIDPEDPDTVPDEVLSEDENPDTLLSFDKDLLDPETIEDKEVVTLGAAFPDLKPSIKVLDKDPVLDPKKVTERMGITDPRVLDGYLQYHQALCFHKRKIYLHASVLKKDIKAEEYQNHSYQELQLLLDRAENSKFYLDQIHLKLSNLYEVLPGQKTSQTCGDINLTDSIIFLKKAVKRNLENEIGFQRAQALKAQEDLDVIRAQLDAIRANPNPGTERPQAGTVPQAEPQVSAQPNLATSTPTRTDVPRSDHQSGTNSFVPPGAQGFSFGAGTTRTGPENSHNFGYGNFTWQRGGTSIRGSRGRGNHPRGGQGGGGQGPNDQDLQDQPPFRLLQRQPDEEELDHKDLQSMIQTVVCSISSRASQSGKRIVAMLDTGSNTTCIVEKLAKALRCKRLSDTVSKSVSMPDGVKILQSYTCEIVLTSGDGLTTQVIIAHTIQNMTEGTSVVDWSKAKKNFAHLRNVPFDAVKRDAKIELLIGSDNAFLFSITNGTLRESVRGDPIAYHTPLGWTCIGPMEPTGTNGSQIHNLLLSKPLKPNIDSVCLQTQAYKITGSQGRKGSRITALLDPGSWRDVYVDREAAVRLRLKRTSKTFTLKVNYFDRHVNLDTYTVEFFLKSCDGTLTQTVTAYTVQNMTKNISAVDWSQEKYKFSDLPSVPFEPLSETNPISLLIGSDYLSLFRNLDTGSKIADESITNVTPLGWTCLGSPNMI